MGIVTLITVKTFVCLNDYCKTLLIEYSCLYDEDEYYYFWVFLKTMLL